MTWVAGVQMASGPNLSANLFEAERLIQRAADAGARLVVLPENFALMSRDADVVATREEDHHGPLQDFLSRQAARHQVWLAGGTIPLRGDDERRARSALLLYDDQGQRVARYDKLHLFDVQVVDSTESYHESGFIEPGERVVVVDSPFGRLGLAICYDLRFPELFRALLDQGAEVILLPSAFTAITGRAHWEPLLRARAIENLCYVVAPAQGGFHANGRETHGHSMIVDPWGTILDQLPRGSGMVLAQLDRGRLETVRKLFPSIRHRRLDCRLNSP